MIVASRSKERRVLVVGDLHAPFIREGYLEHCMAVRDKYNTNHTIFIGDIIDNHYSSFHPTDPDGYGAGEELDRAIDQISVWHSEFPDADVIIGNHDKIIMRKMFKEGISMRWVKTFNEVLNTHSWTFDKEFEYDNVKYIHGLKGGAVNGAMAKARNRGISIVQGHWHAKSNTRWHATDNQRIFAMQVGCGVDEDAYAMAYAEDPMERWIISCGVVLENGQLPIVEPMRL
ncbi:MAG: metallophosphoesterase [Candidatus Kariarchaeaceae archaeon]